MALAMKLFAYADRALASVGASTRASRRPSEFFTGAQRAFTEGNQWDIKGQVLTGGLRFEARNGVNTPLELATKIDAIRTHPKFSGSVEQQGEAIEAMLAAHRFGKLSRKEIGLLAEVFGDDYGKSLLKLEKLDSKAFEAFSYFFNAPKSIMAVADFSGMLRQGILANAARPHKIPRNLMLSVRTMLDEDYAGAVIKDVQAHPKFAEYRAFGGEPVDFARSDQLAGITETEEIFVNNLANDIPFFGDKIAKPSERSYASLLTKLRFEMYVNQVKRWEEPTDGLLANAPVLGKYFKAPTPTTVKTDPQRYRDLNAFINASTGKSNLLDFMRGSTADRVMNLAFWAPRLALSRFEVPLQLLATSEGGLGVRSTSWAVRRVVLKELAQSAVTIGGILAGMNYAGKGLGINVSANPLNSDFGRVRFQGKQPSEDEKEAKARELYPGAGGFLGLTEPRKQDVLRELGASDSQVVFDPLGGFSQPIRLMAQMFTGQGAALATGESYDIKRWAPLIQYVRAKLSPVAGTLTTLGTGSATSGSEVEAVDEIMELWAPLIVGEAQDLIGAEGFMGGLMTIAPALGIGAQSFTTPGLERERLAQQLYNKSFESLDWSAQQEIRRHTDVAEAKTTRMPSETDERRKLINVEAEEKKQAAAEQLANANGFGNPDLTLEYRDARVAIETARAIKLAEVELARSGPQQEFEIPPIEEKPESYAYLTWLSLFSKPVGSGGVMKTTGEVDFDELNRLSDQLYQEVDANHMMNDGPSVSEVRRHIHDEAGLTALKLDDAGNLSPIEESFDGLRDWRHAARWYSWERSDFIETDFTVYMREKTGNPDLKLTSFWDELGESHPEYQDMYEAFGPIYRRGGPRPPEGRAPEVRTSIHPRGHRPDRERLGLHQQAVRRREALDPEANARPQPAGVSVLRDPSAVGRGSGLGLGRGPAARERLLAVIREDIPPAIPRRAGQHRRRERPRGL